MLILFSPRSGRSKLTSPITLTQRQYPSWQPMRALRSRAAKTRPYRCTTWRRGPSTELCCITTVRFICVSTLLWFFIYAISLLIPDNPLHRHHHLSRILQVLLAERRRRRTPVCVEHKEVGVWEIHQSSQVITQNCQVTEGDLCICWYWWWWIPSVFLRGHVTSLAIHPSGKLALSVGTDKTLRWIFTPRSQFCR